MARMKKQLSWGFLVTVLSSSLFVNCGRGTAQKNQQDLSSRPPEGSTYVQANFTYTDNTNTTVTAVPSFSVVCPNAYPDGKAWYQSGVQPGASNLYIITQAPDITGTLVDTTCFIFMTKYTVGGTLDYLPATSTSTPANTQTYSLPAGYNDNGSTYPLPAGGFVPSIETSGNTVMYLKSVGIVPTVDTLAYLYNATTSTNVTPVGLYFAVQASYSAGTFSITLSSANSAASALAFTKNTSTSSQVSFTASGVPAPMFSSTNGLGTPGSSPFNMQDISLNGQRVYTVYQAGTATSGGAGCTSATGCLYNATDCLIILADAAPVTAPLTISANGIPTSSWVSGAAGSAANTWSTSGAPTPTATTWRALAGGASGGWLSATAWGSAQTYRTVPTTWAQADAIYRAIVGTSGSGNNYYPYTAQATNPITGAAYVASPLVNANNHGVYSCVPGTNGIPRTGGTTTTTGVFQTPISQNWGQTITSGANPVTDNINFPGYYNHKVMILYANFVGSLSSYSVVTFSQQTN